MTPWDAWRTRRDADAFARLVQPHLRHALDVALRAGCRREDAEDAVQEGLVRLARERGDAPARFGVRATLVRLVRSRARTLARTSRRRRLREQAAARPEAVAPADGSVRAAAEEALGLLAPEEREAVVLRYLHDLEYREVAHVLGVSENACRVRVSRALARLRTRLGDRAPALVAALGFPATRGEAAWIGAATSKAGGAALASAGGIAMKTGTKLVLAAVLASAATTAGLLATDVVRPRRAPPPRTAMAPEPPTGTLAAPLADLRPTADEEAFLHRALAAERVRRREAVIRPEDSGLDILRRVLEWGADPEELLWDAGRVGSHVRTGAGGRLAFAARGDEVLAIEPLELAGGSAVIELGPGTYRLTREVLADWRTDVRSLEIRGAGRDRTTLGFERGLMTLGGQVEHLRVSDLTLDGGLVLDVRGQTAAVLERLRVRAWPSGGHSAAIGVSGELFLGCFDCEFLGGYGDGTLVLSLRGNALVAFGQCLFADVPGSVAMMRNATAKSVVQFDRCNFENTRLGKSEEAPVGILRVRGGSVWHGPPGLAEEKRAADWGMGGASIEGVTFLPGLPRSTVGDLLDVLAALDPRDAVTIRGRSHAAIPVAVAVPYARRGGPSDFVVQWLLSEPRRIESVPVRLEAGRVVPSAEERWWGPISTTYGGRQILPLTGPDLPALPGGGLAEAVARVPLDRSASAGILALEVERTAGGPRAILSVGMHDRSWWREVAAFDAASGAPLPLPAPR